PATAAETSAARRPRWRSGTLRRRAAGRAHAGITVVRLLPRGGAAVHAAEHPGIFRRRRVALNVAIAEALTLLLQLRTYLRRGRTRFVLPDTPLILRPQRVVGIRHPRAMRRVV